MAPWPRATVERRLRHLAHPDIFQRTSHQPPAQRGVVDARLGIGKRSVAAYSVRRESWLTLAAADRLRPARPRGLPRALMPRPGCRLARARARARRGPPLAPWPPVPCALPPHPIPSMAGASRHSSCARRVARVGAAPRAPREEPSRPRPPALSPLLSLTHSHLRRAHIGPAHTAPHRVRPRAARRVLWPVWEGKGREVWDDGPAACFDHTPVATPPPCHEASASRCFRCQTRASGARQGIAGARCSVRHPLVVASHPTPT